MCQQIGLKLLYQGRDIHRKNLEHLFSSELFDSESRTFTVAKLRKNRDISQKERNTDTEDSLLKQLRKT